MTTASTVTQRYEKLLLVRMEIAAEAFLEVDNLRTSSFVNTWATTEQLPRAVLERAAREPPLDIWVATAETLIKNGIATRYPNAHPREHLESFSRLAVSWMGPWSGGLAGTICLSGRAVIPLVFGRLLLVGSRIYEDESIRWRVDSGVMRLERGQDMLIAEVDLAEPSGAMVMHDEWKFVRQVEVLGIVIETPLPTEGIDCRPKHSSEPTLTEASQLLGVNSRAMLRSTLRAATTSEGPWTAGLLRVPRRLTPKEVLEAACGDRAERSVRIWELLNGARPAPWRGSRTAFARFAARALAMRMLIAEPVEGISIAEPSQEECDAAMLLHQIESGTEVENRVTGRILELERIGRAAGLNEVTTGLSLRKSGHEDSDVEDWSAIDFLTQLDDDDVEQLLAAARTASAANSEEGAYCAAICYYRLGRFVECGKLLRRCLEHDQDVEEYWKLLAFAMRHVGHRDVFERIVFDGERSWG